MTTTSAVSNGSTTTDADAPARREHGIARLREEQCYHLTALVKNALYEAEHLTDQVNGKAMDCYRDYTGTKGTTPLDRDDAISKLTEARACAQVAVDYLYSAIDALRDQDEPSF